MEICYRADYDVGNDYGIPRTRTRGWDTFFFSFLHVSFIQANKAQSLQRIIERSRSKYLRANYVMGSNCMRVHGNSTMGKIRFESWSEAKS